MAEPSSPRPIGKYERLAKERDQRDLDLARRPEGHPRGLRFDEEAADRVVDFIEKFCKHHKGEWAGRPLTLEPWQKNDVIRPIFGWKNPDGTRRYRTAYVEVARKNGKTELCGALGLFLMVADSEPGAEVYASATKKDQAKIVWSVAAAMVKRSRELRRFIEVLKTNLACEILASKFEPLGADSDTLDGLNPHGNIVDELHAHKNRGVWDVLDSGMGARRQPLTIAITTAGIYDPDSIGWQQHDYAQKVLEGTFGDDSFFAFIAAADDGDDVLSEEAQKKANPNYGISVKPEYLARQAKKARLQPGFYNEYVQKHANRWTQQALRWLSTERWEECELEPVDREEREKALLGRTCFGGLDLSSKIDITAFVLDFPNADGFHDIICRFWVPEDRVKELFTRGQKHYQQWVDEGWLLTTPGEVIDYDFIELEIKELGTKYVVQELAFDPWNAGSAVTHLTGEGFTMVEIQQIMSKLTDPSKELEKLIIARKIRHARNPVMAWMVDNAVARADAAGNIMPHKGKAKGKIDGVSALVDALARSMKQEGSVYTPERGFLSL
jgi:phage terminase large subunit-like protein